jgi:arylsulfatase A-like enzyme
VLGWLAGIALLGGCGGEAPLTNLILISIDTLRADHLGFYGYPRGTSPFLDSLAARGVVFERAYAPSPWTLPSHASLLTGLYPSHHGAFNEKLSLPAGVETLADRRAVRGFATGAVVNSWFFDEIYGLARGFESYANVPAHLKRGGAAPSVSALGLRWLGERDGRPFFLFLHYYDVHSDYNAEEEYEALFRGSYAGDIDGSTAQLREIQRGERRLDGAGRDHLIDLYDAEIRQMDARLELLFEQLEDAGALEGSLVVITSDHGEEFLEHGGVLHGGTYYEEVLRVPLVVVGPDVPAGLRVETPVSLVDLAPTLLALFGEPAPAESEFDGVDVSSLWRGDTGAWSERGLFGEADSVLKRRRRFRSILRGQHKLIAETAGGGRELYDLQADPTETRNIAPERRKLARSLEAELRDGLGRPVPGRTLPELSPTRRAQLEALGYAQ